MALCRADKMCAHREWGRCWVLSPCILDTQAPCVPAVRESWLERRGPRRCTTGSHVLLRRFAWLRCPHEEHGLCCCGAHARWWRPTPPAALTWSLLRNKPRKTAWHAATATICEEYPPLYHLPNCTTPEVHSVKYLLVIYLINKS